MKRLRNGLSVLMTLAIVACGNSGSGDSDIDRVVRDTPDANGGDTTPDDSTDPGTPVDDGVVDLGSSAFLPLYSNPQWYYQSSELPVILGEEQTIAATVVRPLLHGDGRLEYFSSTESGIAFGGITAKLLENDPPVILDVQFAKFKTILGTASNYSISGDAFVTLSGVYEIPTSIPYTGTASRLPDAIIDTAQFGEVPAAGVKLTFRLGDLLTRTFIHLTYPALDPLFESIETRLWFSPGIGIVQYQTGAIPDVLTQVEGIPQPLVFIYASSAALGSIAPRQIKINGEILTDSEWTRTLYYRVPTTESGWLDVSFNANGSWQAQVIKPGLKKGIYAATIRFENATEQHDVNVSMLVQ